MLAFQPAVLIHLTLNWKVLVLEAGAAAALDLSPLQNFSAIVRIILDCPAILEGVQ